ncbi:hypothetical protein H0G86_005787 [Trichoderma simmonsii]|uniref:Uncharacterized protein n=1 Tax=Trichoderma simmonsii TaxID=1491479 RepID=A0A8G0PFH3_9HYPO|nr:hypothetical protein H0G86_005787 [Trichoderma simmonsii]
MSHTRLYISQHHTREADSRQGGVKTRSGSRLNFIVLEGRIWRFQTRHINVTTATLHYRRPAYHSGETLTFAPYKTHQLMKSLMGLNQSRHRAFELRHFQGAL